MGIKKTILIAVMALISLTTVSCGGTGDNDSKTLTTAVQTAQGQTQSKTMSKNDFSQIPEGAENALDIAAKRSEGAFETQGDRSFGYTGTAEVNGMECYCFSLFDNNDENTYHIADIAVAADGEKVFTSKAGTNEFSELSTPVKAQGWRDKQTPAFSK